MTRPEVLGAIGIRGREVYCNPYDPDLKPGFIVKSDGNCVHVVVDGKVFDIFDVDNVGKAISLNEMAYASGLVKMDIRKSNGETKYLGMIGPEKPDWRNKYILEEVERFCREE
jgi:hypothetical protein